MYKDEIIAEVWQNRDAYAARHHHNLVEIVADLQARQERPDCKLVDRRKPMAPTGIAEEGFSVDENMLALRAKADRG
uniref:Uncharacterized protein n=1 Tax=Candidatus Kentrum sp. TUN TaxID=2126343 RepID=A0A451A8A3_9GAMM|nr:MAG: hypothetical protein BECKTUN1418E_GA0071001_101039 [Candidatus Kentron sp. TUN]VFK62276.1 MAG: hypothetical protein BECKTUN1418F_GA0071002_12973 [Candidatus Kentron sp. TUN]VFK64797.1 MAG: hypothetical protein BECKTUN1418D_GA0071000_12893 [Candidatus Kentron sp. TUN]